MSPTVTGNSKDSRPNNLTVSTQIGPGDNLTTFSRMLKSVAFADRIDIYFMGENPASPIRQLAAHFHAQLIPVAVPPVVEFIRTRQVKNAKSRWVLITDFDEVITRALRQEILAAVKTASNPTTVYAIKRRNYSLGFPLRFGGWGDDYVIRLFRRDAFLSWPAQIHSTPRFKGQLQKLVNYMEHHKDESLEYIVNKTNRYTDQEATQFHEGGITRVTPFTLLRKWKMEMLRRGIFKGGLLDGRIGLLQSLYQGYSVFLSWAKLYEKQHSSHE